MPEPETMRVRSKAFPGGEVINKSDFNPSKHKLLDEPEESADETAEAEKEAAAKKAKEEKEGKKAAAKEAEASKKAERPKLQT